MGYAFFRPSKFEEGDNGFDEFDNPERAYDLSNNTFDSYCKTDTDRSNTNYAYASGFTFLPNSKAGPYKEILTSLNSYSFCETLPAGAVFTGFMGGMNYSSQVSALGNVPLVELGITTAKNSHDTSLFNATGAWEPAIGNTSQRGVRTGYSTLTSASQILQITENWIKDNIYLLYKITGRHTGWLSSTVIRVYELYGIGIWYLPFTLTVTNGLAQLDSGTSYGFVTLKDYKDNVSYVINPRSGYSSDFPIISFSQGNPSYTWNSSTNIFTIPSIEEGVVANITFREECTIKVFSNNENFGTVSPANITTGKGANIEISATPKSGYKFIAWNDGNTQPIRIIEADNSTYTATFAPINYTINFDGNNATVGAKPSIIATFNSETEPLSNPFKKIGYIFKSWNTQSNGMGESYLNNFKALNLTNIDGKSITLYAQWEFVGDLNYNNLFSFSDWGTSSSGAIDGEYAKTTNFNINFKDGSINIKDISSPSPYDAYTRYGPDSNFYHISVNPDTEYFFNFTITQNYSSNDQGQFFVFYYTLDKDTNKLKQSTITSHRGWRPINITGNYSGEFKTPLDCVAIGLRFGIYSSLADITFSDVLICEKTKYNNIISKIPNYKIRDYLPEITSIQELPSLNTGYLFDGWRAENNKLASTLTLSEVKSSISSIIAYSFERPITYKIHFNKNCQEGTGIISSQTFIYDEPKKLTKSEAFQRYRYQFVNWKAILNNEEIFFNDEEEILNLLSNQGDEITLYAQWEYIPIENTIKLDDNIFASKVLFDNIPVIEILIDKTVFFREHL